MTSCTCNDFPASLGNVTFEANVSFGAGAAPICPVDINSTFTPQLVVRGGAATVVRLFPAAGADTSSVEAFETSDTTLASYSRVRLTIAGGVASLIVDNSGTGTVARDLSVSVGGSERLHVTTAGNVGIGVASPLTPLQVAGVMLASGSQGRLTLARNDGSDPTTTKTWQLDNDANALRIFQQPDLNSVGTVYLTLQDGGYVGIGTTTPGYPLDVAGTIRATGMLMGGDVLLYGALKDSTGTRTNVDQDGCYYAS